MPAFTFGSLFSGIGGFDLGLERAGMTCKWQSEIDPFCNKVLAKHWPMVKRYGNIKEIEKHNLEPVDLICGGFPCQPFSVAGKQRGTKDDRYLWPEMFRVITEVRPTWVIGENVPGIINMELDKALSDLEDQGYEAQVLIIPACAVDAPHRRDRVWIVAHNSQSRARMETHRGGGQRGQTVRTLESEILRQKNWSISPEGVDSDCENVANAERMRPQRKWEKQKNERQIRLCSRETGREASCWLPESEFCRISNEFSERLDEDRLTKTKGHDSVGLTQNKGEYHATSKDARSRKILPSLREKNAQETIQRNIGGFDEIQEKNILRSSLYGGKDDAGQANAYSIKEKSSGLQGEHLRILWNGKEFKYSSQRFESSEQREIKLDDVMCFLSYVMALDAWEPQEFSHEKAKALQRLRQGISEIKTRYVPKTLPEIQKIWRSLSNEETDWLILRIGKGSPFCAEWPEVSRVATVVPRRVDRLRSLGNAVVPLVVEIIGRFIMKIEDQI